MQLLVSSKWQKMETVNIFKIKSQFFRTLKRLCCNIKNKGYTIHQIQTFKLLHFLQNVKNTRHEYRESILNVFSILTTSQNIQMKVELSLTCFFNNFITRIVMKSFFYIISIDIFVELLFENFLSIKY